MTSDCPKWKRPSVIELVAMTAIPIIGIVFFGWSGIQILLLYWFENAIVGVFNLLRFALTKPVYENRADYIAAHPWLLQHYPVSEQEWEEAKGFPVPLYPSMKEKFIPLFLGHYTFFLWVHAFLLATLVAKLPAGEWWHLFAEQWSSGMAMAVASMAVTHGWRFWNEDLQGRSYTRSCPFLTMIYPYRRLLIMHLALLLGGLLFVQFALPAALAILLILLKSAFDMNWIRIPLGPKTMDWRMIAEKDEKKKSGKIVGKTVTERPEGCRTEMEDMGSCLRFTLPAQGLRNLWRKMRAGGCLVVGLVVIGTFSAMAYGFVAEFWKEIMCDGDSYWGLLFIMTVSQAIGTVWMLMLSLLVSVPWSVLAYGTVRGSIELTEDKLVFSQQGFPKGKRGEIPRGEIVDLGMSATGSSMNEFKVVELRIRLRDGSDHTFFTGRDPEELNWISTQVMLRLLE